MMASSPAESGSEIGKRREGKAGGVVGCNY